MASNRPKSKNTNKKKTSNRQVKNHSENSGSVNNMEYSDRVKTEVEVLIMFAISVVLLIGVLGGGKGPLLFIGGFLFGLFGVFGYIFPVFLFVICTFIKANTGNKKIRVRVAAFIIMYISLISMIHILSADINKGFNLIAVYLGAIENRSGGGIVGAIFSAVIYNVVGKVATVFIFIILFIICLIIVTQKPLLAMMKKSGKKAYNSTVSNLKERSREINREKNVVSFGERARAIRILDIDTDNPKPMDFSPIEFTKKCNIKPNPMGGNVGMKEINLNPFENFEFDHYNDVNDKERETEVSCNEYTDPIYSGKTEIYNAVGKSEEMKNTVVEFTDFKISSKADEYENEEYTSDDDIDDECEDDFNAREIRFESDHNLANENTSDKLSEMTDIKITASSEDKSLSECTLSEESETLPNEDLPKIDEANDSSLSDEKLKEKEIEYTFPPIDLLKKGTGIKQTDSLKIKETMKKLEDTFASFNITVNMAGASIGPTVTRYELSPAPGVKVSQILARSDDIKLALAAADIRIEAPIPGKSYIGIEVPNSENSTVMLRDLLEDAAFKNNKCKLAFAVGKDLSNRTVVEDISKMPHLLIAGATGSGKSVCINTLILSILYTCSPKDVRLIMVDPKVVELSVYNGIPHLLAPIVTDAKKAAGVLNWAVAEMTERYQLFANAGVRDLTGYNRWVEDPANKETVEADGLTVLPKIVIIVDELADLMMVSAKEAEESICRLAQLARAAGMHLILATQRPSVNVITGLIKANMPSRIAFSVTSGVDSRTILDMNGAEKLLGKGDMLFGPQWLQTPIRLQGAFISDEEVERVTSYLKEQAKNSDNQTYDTIEKEIAKAANQSIIDGNHSNHDGDYGLDPLFIEAAALVVGKEKASIGMLQRALKIGFNRAGRIMDQMETQGVVGEDEGTKPRSVLMSLEEFEEYKRSFVD